MAGLVYGQLTAGHETTTALLATGIKELLAQRDRWAELCADPALAQVVRVNLKGPWLCAKACVPVMRDGGGGAIVNVSSATVLSGSPLWAHYVASKGGVMALTRAMAREAGDLGIRVNTIAPGFTLTDASRALIEDAETYGVARGAIKSSATPEDIVGTALYLASPASAFVTGQTIVVDGGRQFL